MVCASSMNKIIGVRLAFTSSITPRRRLSNSPLTLAPACNKPRSRVRSATFNNGSGTSAATMRNAKPSTTAVLPTPGSPVRMGLFWRRRRRMSIICRISASRPNTASILPARACAVRSTVYLSNAGVRWVLGVVSSSGSGATAALPMSPLSFEARKIEGSCTRKSSAGNLRSMSAASPMPRRKVSSTAKANTK